MQDWEKEIGTGGWTRVVETNGFPRVPASDRIIRGFITSGKRDQQGEVVAEDMWTKACPDGKTTRLEWLMQKGIVSYVHGMAHKNLPEILHVGLPFAYRKIGDKIEVMAAIHDGSETMDDCWSEIQKVGTSGGFSIGGRPIQKVNCDANGEHCTIADGDIIEFSWTPDPANVEARVKDIAMVKSMQEIIEKSFSCECLKCGHVQKSEAHCKDLKCDKCGSDMRRLDRPGVGKSNSTITAAADLIAKCKDCDEFVTGLVKSGKSVAEALNKFASIVEAGTSSSTVSKDTGDMDMTKKEEDKKPEEEEEKKPEEEKKKTAKEEEEKKPPKDENEEKSKKAMDIEKAITQLIAEVASIKASMTKTNAPEPEKNPDPTPYAMTEDDAIKALVKSGKKVEDVETNSVDIEKSDSTDKIEKSGNEFAAFQAAAKKKLGLE